MIFEELTISDFRQFAGTQSVKFATDPQKNVTVIHGFSGAGKTTLLNAFTWLLYGEFSPDFESVDRLDSESSFAALAPGGKLVTEVKAVFRDGDRKFTAVRTISVALPWRMNAMPSTPSSRQCSSWPGSWRSGRPRKSAGI